VEGGAAWPSFPPLLSFGLLGLLEVEAGGRRVELVGTRPKVLLALLLTQANRVVSADRLIDDLWAGEPTPGATATLQGYVSELRKALAEASGAPAPIVTRRPGYLIQVEDDQVDVLRFERLTDSARAAAADRPEVAAACLREALRLWRGPALADFLDQPFARPLAARLEEARAWALQERVELDLAAGRHAELLTELDQLTTEHPLRERLWAQRMVALYRCGRQAEALRAYQELRRRLDEDLGIDPSPALQRLESRILAQDPELEPPPPPSRPAAPQPQGPAPGDGTTGRRGTALPAQPMPFVGRTEELQLLRALFPGTRLLTLTGAGGCGKTRLAVQLAGEAAEHFAGGARFVDLSALCDPAVVPEAVGVAIGLGHGTSSVESLCERSSESQMLVVLDNCEHLVDACAELADAMLASCPGIAVLVTSQEELRVRGETVWRVPPLRLPDHDPALEPGRILAAEAVQLFVERARSALPGFEPDEQALADVAHVCRRLDGIPLAIELAAALVTVLPVSQIVSRLDDRFALLTRGSRRSVPQQRTLRAAIDWSYDLLEPSERELFARLSVFVGSFTLEAAEATAGRYDRFLADFSALVSKSIVTAHPGTGGVHRYRLLETIRQYGLERLAGTPAERALRRRHAAYFTDFAEAADRQLHGRDPADWSTHVEQELANLRSALEWSFSNGDLEVGVRLAGALWSFSGRMGQLEQARRWLESALDRRDELPPPLQLKALTAAMTVAFSQGDYRCTSAIGEEAVALAEELDDRKELAVALMVRGGAAVYEGNSERAVECLERSLDHCKRSGDRWGTAWVLTFLGVLSRRSGELEKARLQLEEALSTFRGLRDDHNQAMPLMQLALVSQQAGDPDAAVRRCEEAIMLARRLGEGQLAHGAYCIYGLVELARGHREEARRHLVASLRAFRGTEHQLVVALAVEGLAVVAHQEDRHREAAELWGFAGRLRAASAGPMTPERAAERDEHLDRARRRIGGELVEQALVAGGALQMDQVLALAEPQRA
jgi:predicted ATPase/DNA-binding SARP family transcriptional activator